MIDKALSDLAKATARLQETVRENGTGVPTPSPAPVRPEPIPSQLTDEERAAALAKVKADLLDGLDASRLAYLDLPGAMPLDTYIALHGKGTA